MEHPGAAPTSVDDSLFSERVRLWLDEGDRLEAEVAARPAAESPVEPGHVGQALRRLGERAARHRVTVL
ncbi:MAG TPA: hypothetical protein VHO06_11540, partial [Polyangia bacterium]|nr:hypothetical protein [Polyangia bacterium]